MLNGQLWSSFVWSKLDTCLVGTNAYWKPGSCRQAYHIMGALRLLLGFLELFPKWLQLGPFLILILVVALGPKREKATLSMPSSKLPYHQGLHTAFSPQNSSVYLRICRTSCSTNASCCVAWEGTYWPENWDMFLWNSTRLSILQVNSQFQCASKYAHTLFTLNLFSSHFTSYPFYPTTCRICALCVCLLFSFKFPAPHPTFFYVYLFPLKMLVLAGCTLWCWHPYPCWIAELAAADRLWCTRHPVLQWLPPQGANWDCKTERWQEPSLAVCWLLCIYFSFAIMDYLQSSLL